MYAPGREGGPGEREQLFPFLVTRQLFVDLVVR